MQIKDGIICVNKSAGMTSRDVVNKLTKVFATKKIGHTGTLDPIATGVLVCTIGKCTKLNEFLVSTRKSYNVELVLGYETDTLDFTGSTVYKNDNINNSTTDIKETIMGFVGEYNQEVPAYSAVKIDGKKLYEYARNNLSVVLPKRLVKIYNIDKIKFSGKKISFDVTVSKGTYIRSLVRDIGRKLGTYATMINLTRTSQGIYNLEDCYTLDEIEQGNYKLFSLDDIFKNIPVIALTDSEYKKIFNGSKYLNETIKSDYVAFKYKHKIFCLYKKVGDTYKMAVKFE